MNKENILRKESIISMEKELLDAMQNSDLEALSKLLHNDLLFNIPSGHTITKAIDLENYKSRNMSIDDITSNEQTINLIDDTAVVSTLITMKGKFLEHRIDGNYQIIRVWKVFGKTWKVIAGSSNHLQNHN